MNDKRYVCLIVDDESVEREGLRFLLGKREYPIRILEAANGEAALKVMENAHVDILLTDIRMPFMDGLELANRVRARDARMQILICTAYGEFEYARKAIACSVTGYLLKPIQRAEFYAQFDKMLADLDERARREQLLCIEEEKCWYDLLHGCAPGEAVRAKLAAHQVDVDAARPLVMLLCLPDGVLERCMPGFDPADVRRARGLWAIDPARLLILVMKDAILDESALKALAQRAQTRAREAMGALPGVFIAQPPEGIAGLAKVWHTLDEQSDMRLYAPGAVHISGKNLAEEDEKLLERLTQLLSEVNKAVSARDLTGAYLQMEAFLSHMRLVNDASALYMRYLVSEAVTLLHYAKGEKLQKDALDQILAARTAEDMAALVERYLRMLAPEGETSDKDAVNGILSAIHQRYAEPLTLDSLAKGVYMTPSYVSYLFKRRTGTTLIKYLTNYRLTRAAEKLISGAQNVTEVSQSVGYDNMSYFISLFKARYGVSPAQYAKTMKTGNEKP